MSRRTPRLIAGAAILLILVILGALLVAPYTANWRLQSYLNDLADDPATPKKPVNDIRSAVLNQAGSLGLPVHSDDVQVSLSASGVKIEVLYIVHVDMAGYSIDLHFRPTAGG